AELDCRSDGRRPGHGRHDDLLIGHAPGQQRGVVHQQVGRGPRIDEQRVPPTEPAGPLRLELLDERALRQPGIGLEPADQLGNVVLVDGALSEQIALARGGWGHTWAPEDWSTVASQQSTVATRRLLQPATSVARTDD